jgi:3-hydroxybutyryl-CoA dehydrogenase
MTQAQRAIIGCIGAGRMGRGIAHAFAYAGHAVRLIDIKSRDDANQQRFFADTTDEIRSSLQSIADIGGFDPRAVDTISRRVALYSCSQAKAALQDVPYIFEAVPETVEAKTSALALIDEFAEPEAIVASTTSTFLSTQLSDLSGRPRFFLNVHWLNPAFLVPLVEVSPTRATDRNVVEVMMNLLISIGKVPVECAASPGYIVPRIQALAMNEAARLVEEGVATAEDIDKAVRYGFGFRFAVLGLLEFIDWGGGDILYYASRYLSTALKSDRFNAPDVIQTNMAEGRNGLRDGQGFYDYSTKDMQAYRLSRLSEFMRMLRQAGLARPPADF